MCLPRHWRPTVLFLPFLTGLHAAPPRLVEDINEKPDASELGIEWMLPTKGGAIFTRPSIKYGKELWVAGPAGQIRLLKDIWPGADGSYPSHVVSDGDTIYFQASTPKHGAELWQSDGTPKGTRLLADVWRGTESSNPMLLHAGDGRAFFEADTEFDRSVWASGGPAGLEELNPWDAESGRRFEWPYSFSSHGSTTWFLANHREIWKSDGSFTGTIMAEPVSYDEIGGDLWLHAAEGVLFVEGYDHTTGCSTVGSRSASGPTQRISPAIPGWEIDELVVLKNRLLLAIEEGFETGLWASDGTVTGTGEIALQHDGLTYVSPRELTAWNGAVYFTAHVPDPAPFPGTSWPKHALWRTDGTEAGTTVVMEYEPGFSPGEFYPAAGRLHFRSRFDIIWQSDGTASGTIASPIPAVANLGFFSQAAVAGDQLVFLNEGPGGDSMWRTRSGGLQPEEITMAEGSQSGIVGELHPGLSGQVLFGGTSGSGALELWRSDGTAKNTKPMWNTALDVPGSTLQPMATVGSRIVFFLPGYSSLFGGQRSIVATDLDGGNPTTLLEIASGDYIYDSVTTGNRCFFRSGGHLWTTDGTVAGTHAIAGPSGNPALTELHAPTALGGNIYFFAKSNISYGLWRSDGSAVGTVLMKEFGPLSAGHLERLDVAGQRLCFFHSHAGGVIDLWTSDGSADGTVKVLTLTGQVDFSKTVGAQHFFIFRPQADNTRWWYRSDGTAAGTAPFADLSRTALTTPPLHAAVGDTLFYVASDLSSHPWIGPELWKTDGTTAGTMLVRDIFPGEGDPLIQHLAAVGNEVYFGATDGRHGIEVWRSDGTHKGTRMTKDLERGPGNSMPEGFTASGNKLYFHATRPKLGKELHVLDLPKKRAR